MSNKRKHEGSSESPCESSKRRHAVSLRSSTQSSSLTYIEQDSPEQSLPERSDNEPGQNINNQTFTTAVSTKPDPLARLLGSTVPSFSLPNPPVPDSESHSPQSVYLGKNPAKLPPLPIIRDDALAKVPFIHRGTLSGEASEAVGSSYERLEFLGDAYLELMASRAVLLRFPQFSPGKLSQVRQLLVRNETLGEFSMAYGLHERAQMPKELRTKYSLDKTWIKVMGDLFEAYVAAVISSNPEHGFITVENWMKELWEPILLKQSGEIKAPDPMAKQNLATKVCIKGIKPSYREVKPPRQFKSEGQMEFYIGVFITGWGYTNQLLGSGNGPSKTEAGYAAAEAALRNPLTAKIQRMKREHDAKAKANSNSEFIKDTQQKKEISAKSK
ncbi:MAG: hypothetical protein LQ351_005265 [Letrouitia transgressa]|nr:MAG: hypothetical protein LQ351_005265 [Letrouitia transgressa]